MDDNKYSHEIQRLSNEILNDKSLPNQNYSQSVVKVMQEKIDFFKSNSGWNSIDYNTISGQLTILNGKQKILCQRKNPEFDLFKEFGVIEEDVQYIRVLLSQTSVQNKEISVQIKATVENDSQMDIIVFGHMKEVNMKLEHLQQIPLRQILHGIQ